jgi:hypothetical protein
MAFRPPHNTGCALLSRCSFISDFEGDVDDAYLQHLKEREYFYRIGSHKGKHELSTPTEIPFG